MLIHLSQQATLGKASATEDYRLLHQSGECRGEFVRLAQQWLQVLLLTPSNRRAAILHRVANEWWLFHPELEDACDSAGRPRGYVVFGQLAEPLEIDWSPNVVVRFGCVSAPRDRLVDGLEALPAHPEAWSPSLVAAALVLSVGERVMVGTAPQAVTVLTKVGLQAIEWLAIFPAERPTSQLPGAAGLLIGAVPQIPAWATDLVAMVGMERVVSLPLDHLASLPHSSEQRRKLLLIALGIKQPWNEGPISEPSIDWLCSSAAGRAAARGLLAPDQLAFWLASQHARAEDLSSLQAMLEPEHARLVQALLQNHPQAVAIYRSLYPEDGPGLLAVLTPPMQATWNALVQGRAAEVAAEQCEPLLTALDNTPLLESIGLVGAATAALKAGEQGSAVFSRQLIKHGLALDVATAIVRGGTISQEPVDSPRLAPDPSWLAAVSAGHWLAQSTWALDSMAWRSWWIEGTKLLLGAGRLDRQAVFRLGVSHRQADLLKTLDVSPEILLWLDPRSSISLPIPAERWDETADPLVETAWNDGSLFNHLCDPLEDDRLDWIEARLENSESRHRFQKFRSKLAKGQVTEVELLQQITLRLTRIQLLKHICHLQRQPASPDRRELLRYLISCEQLSDAEQEWLSATIMVCRSLPHMPAWSAAELMAMLPLLDPVRDVVRPIMDRDERDPDEAPLLEQLVARLQNYAPASPPPAASARQAARRPDWVAALRLLPGWGEFANVDLETQWRALQEHAQSLLNAAGARLPTTQRSILTEIIAPG